MKIAIVTANLGVHGVSTFVINLGQWLQASGHDVMVVALARGEWWSRLAEVGLPCECLPKQGGDSVASHPKRLAAWLTRQAFDGLIVNIGSSHSRPLALCLHYLPDSLPVLLSLRNDTPEVYNLLEINRNAWNCAVGVSLKVQQMAATCFTDKPIHCIINGIDLPTDPQLQTRLDWALPLRLLFVGRLENRQKGVFWLPEILAACRRRGLAVHLTVIGGGPDSARLAQLFMEKDLADLVVMRGFQVNSLVMEAMRTHHVLLMPSNFEGLGNVLLESLANGCVPLASRLPGVTDAVIENGVNGLLVEPNDITGFVAAIARLMQPDDWRTYSKAGANYARQMFSIPRMGEQYLHLLKALQDDAYPLSMPRSRQRKRGASPFTWRDYLPQPLRVRLSKTVPAVQKLIRSIRLTSLKAHPKLAIEQAAIPDQVIRCPQNPIISEQLTERVGDNINGPSLIKVPAWLPNSLGRYYLYFAHHQGDTIRLAYADDLAGPWHIYAPGTLTLAETICTGHIASPDIHIDHEKQEIRMYFHGPVAAIGKQLSLVATSKDGIHFTASSAILGDSYFRVFEWQGYTYAMARLGVLYRSKDGLTNFEPGPNPFQTDSSPSTVRHVALKLDGNVLTVFYSRIGDNPESILFATIELLPNWRAWKASEAVLILQPEMTYEGADLPYAPSKEGLTRSRVRQLRDPAIFREEGRDYLLYSVAGESGIALAELQGGR